MMDLELRAAPIRRGLALAVVAGFALLMAMMGVQARAPIVPFAIAGVAGWACWRLALATRGGLRLGGQGLETLSGDLVVRYDQIARVERGAFAFKPSNGFVLRLHRAQPRAWVPGLWWCSGRRIGVGGVTQAGAAKAMAEEIARRLQGAPGGA